MSRKRSEAQPILDRRDDSIHLPEHVSAQTVKFAETWRSTSGNGAAVKNAPVTIYKPGCDPVVVSHRLRPLKVHGATVTEAAPVIVSAPVATIAGTAFEVATVQAKSRREQASRDRGVAIRRAMEGGSIGRLVKRGLMSEDAGYTLAAALYDRGELSRTGDHTGSARK